VGSAVGRPAPNTGFVMGSTPFKCNQFSDDSGHRHGRLDKFDGCVLDSAGVTWS